MSSLTLNDVTVRHGSTLAVDRLSLEIADGERLVLLGPSGSGKTTVLRVIAGLITPDAGDVCFDGRSVLSVPPERRGAAMVFQNHALLPFRTVAENVGFGLTLRRSGHAGRPGRAGKANKPGKTERVRRVAEALEQVQLTGLEDRWPNELSGGQQQRVALARALVVEPELLLLDEPLSSLDRSLRDDLATMICSLQERLAITTVMVTHDQQEATIVADRVAVISDGRLRCIGRPDEILDPAAPATDPAATPAIEPASEPAP